MCVCVCVCATLHSSSFRCLFSRYKVRVAGTPCRDSVNACDLPEYCRGNSGFCPEDFYVMDGLSCEDASAYCYEGRCQTYDSQCRVLFEPGTLVPQTRYVSVHYRTSHI